METIRTASMTLRLGGVPEHFNHVFALAEKHGLYQKHNVQVQFVVQACGTGQMIESLEHDEVDVIVALTEGLVRHILTQPTDVRLLGTYVNSPLCWALSTRPGKETGSSMDGKTFGYSRPGSGSQLMAHVLAHRDGISVKTALVGNFQALRDSVLSGETDAFLWETFTTKPFHDSGALKRSGQVVAPWPAFMYAAKQSVVTKKMSAMENMLAAVQEAAVWFHAQQHAMPAEIAAVFGLAQEDAEEWYRAVDIVAHRRVSAAALETVESTLVAANVMDRATTKTWEQCIEPRLAALTE